MNGKSGIRRWCLAFVSVFICIWAASLAPAASNKIVAATGKCQSAQVRALASYYKAVFAGWAKSAVTGVEDGSSKTAARAKLVASWDKSVAGAAKQGANLANPTLDSVMGVLEPTENSLADGISGGLILPDPDAGKLGSAFCKASSGAFAKLVSAYTNHAKTGSDAKLDSDLAKIRAGLLKTWGQALATAEGKGVVYTGMTETEVMNNLDQMVRDMIRTVAEGPIHIQLQGGLVDGATTNLGHLQLLGSVVNPTGDDSSGFGGRIVANVNGVEVTGSVSPRGAKLAGPSEAVKQARAQAKIEGRDPGPLAPVDLSGPDATSTVQWGFDITIPMDFGTNTIQIRLYDLDANLLAASQTWTVFSTTPPADFLATLTWDTNGTDVDFHSSSKALDGSYDYGFYHSWYGGHTSGFQSNMTLDFDNTYGYGPEHITVEKGNPVGESIYLKVYYYSDHVSDPDPFIPSTAFVNVKLHGQSVFDGSSGLGAESTDSAWGSGAHIWDVGEFTLDPTDQYQVTIGQIDTASFPQVTLHVNVQGRDDTGALTGVDGLTAANFYAINNNYFMTLSSATGSAGDYQLTYTDKATGKRPVFVAVTREQDTTIRSGTSDVKTYGKSYALLVGINDYQTINDLNYCVPDVDSMQTALQATQMFSGADTQVTKLTDSAASKAAVIAAIGNVSAAMKKEDLFIFDYSGHGGDGANENQQILCMWDSSNANYAGDISVVELQTALDACAYGSVTNVYVILDACFTGNFIGQRAAEAVAAGNKPRFYLKPGQAPRTAVQPFAKTFARNLGSRLSYFVMAAAKGSEVSWDVGALGHGLFTNYLLEAIGGTSATDLGPANTNGDVMTTCEEAFAYLQPLVVQYSTANMTTVQTPRSYDDDTANPARLKFIW